MSKNRNKVGFCIPYIYASGSWGMDVLLCETNKRLVWCSLDRLAEEPRIENVKFCEVTFLWTALNHTNDESMQSQGHTKSKPK